MGLALWLLCYSRKPSLQAWKCSVRKCFMGWTSKPAFSCGGGEGRVLQCDSLGLCLSCGSTQSMGYYIGRVFSCKESSSDMNFISSSELEPSMMVPSFQSSRSMCESCSSSVCGQECCRNLHLNYTLWIPLHLAFYTYLLPMEEKKKIHLWTCQKMFQQLSLGCLLWQRDWLPLPTSPCCCALIPHGILHPPGLKCASSAVLCYSF